MRTELAKAFAWFLLFDLCWYPLSISQYESVPAPDVFSDSVPHQALLALSTGIMNYCTLSLQFSVFAALTVAIGMYTPQDWPPLMGRLRDVSTVRNFWGRFWHQNLRRVCPTDCIFSRCHLLTLIRNSRSHSTSSPSTFQFVMAHWCQDICNYIWHSSRRPASTISGL